MLTKYAIILRDLQMINLKFLSETFGVHQDFEMPISYLTGVAIILVLLTIILKIISKIRHDATFRTLLSTLLEAIRISVNHRDGSQPITIHPWLKKLKNYIALFGWSYVCFFLTCFLTLTLIMFILRSHQIDFIDSFKVLGIQLIIAWMIRFSFIETRIAFCKIRPRT